jgi:hypothetical protein
MKREVIVKNKLNKQRIRELCEYIKETTKDILTWAAIIAGFVGAAGMMGVAAVGMGVAAACIVLARNVLVPAAIIGACYIYIRNNIGTHEPIHVVAERKSSELVNSHPGNRLALAMDYVLASEGGYVNHQADRGGPTNIGISLRFLRSIDADDADINGDDRVDIQDVKSMSLEQASGLYKKYFYEPCRIDEFHNEQLAIKFFDMAVNLGPGTATKLLQGVLGVQRTGKVGVTTLAAVNAHDGAQTLKELQAALETHYRTIADNNPSQKVFLEGWLKRARRMP